MKRLRFTLGLFLGLGMNLGYSVIVGPFPGNGHYYEAVANPNISWHNAKNEAENRTFMGTKGHLATLTSPDENSWVWENLGHPNCYYLGGTDEETEGTWKWITGEIWSWSNWAPSEPNNLDNEDYLEFWNNDSSWNDITGRAGHFEQGYIVEYPVTPTNIVILPSSGPIGTAITLQGQNFATNSLISIDFGTHLTITTTQSNENGTFLTTFIASNQPQGTKIITASDSQGNIATTTFYLTQPLADLAITYLRLSPPTIYEGGRMMIVTTVQNLNDIPVANVKIGYFDQGILKETHLIGTLSARETRHDLTIIRVYPAGNHNIKTMVDSNNEISESNEENNAMSCNKYILPDPEKSIIRGTVTSSETNLAIPNAIVLGYRQGGGVATALEFTDPEGKYFIGQLIEGTYSLFAFKYGYYSQYKQLYVATASSNIQDFSLKKWIRLSNPNNFSEHLKMFEPLDFENLMIASLCWNLRKSYSLPSAEGTRTIITLSPSKIDIGLNEEFSLEIIANTKNLTGANLSLSFDPTKLLPIVIESPNNNAYLLSQITEGSINIKTTFLDEPKGLSGRITLARIRFKAIAENTETKITLSSKDLKNCLNLSQEADISNEATIYLSLPQETELLQSYPNPAKDGCYIPFKLSKD
ncbi:MAG: CARDB domain-containing protein, partial [bacterium]